MKTLSAKDRARADATAFKTMDKKKIGIQASMDILKAMDAEKKNFLVGVEKLFNDNKQSKL